MTRRLIETPMFSSTAARDAWYTPSGGNGANPVNGDICVMRSGIGTGVQTEAVQIYDTGQWRVSTSSKQRGES